ncbi:hypothetical protein H6F55_00350 [Phormidium sp. FACHB-322]|nr:hypothetical protein [Phormidium sp. FACHB-77]MBD2028445.1 hypothetical protein [Phormidium sp. FACHB-322]MBD2051849.1 hypothetical protein [Leptolyngbya sp. FACHB-60]
MRSNSPASTSQDPIEALAEKKHIKITEINYRRNVESDYTEKMEALDKAFDYESNRDHWWSEPELSLLYGTPLYDEASETQRKALNHLYWATQYNQTAATEANAVLYNQVTAGVFSAIGGYDTLCEELDLETAQERHHIHAFHSMGYKTKKALLGQNGFNASIQGKALRGKSGQRPTPSSQNEKTKATASGSRNQSFVFDWQSSPLAAFQGAGLQDSAFRFATHRIFLKEQAQFYSGYLHAIDQKGEPIPAQTTGLLGQIAPRSLLQFFTLNCGSSPFIACVFYATRFMANMLLKNFEYGYVQYYRELEKNESFIPAPTAVSYNHLMDEAFHTTTSQLIAQDLYKDFAKPTAYEKFVANLTIYRAQVVGLRGLSGGIPAIFRNDDAFILSFYRLLQSPIFGFSDQDALIWLERCLCQEHEGFHLNLKHHQRLLSDLRRHFEPMDYLWPVNREARVMAAGQSVERAMADNTRAFGEFARSVA